MEDFGVELIRALVWMSLLVTWLGLTYWVAESRQAYLVSPVMTKVIVIGSAIALSFVASWLADFRVYPPR